MFRKSLKYSPDNSVMDFGMCSAVEMKYTRLHSDGKTKYSIRRREQQDEREKISYISGYIRV